MRVSRVALSRLQPKKGFSLRGKLSKLPKKAFVKPSNLPGTGVSKTVSAASQPKPSGASTASASPTAPATQEIKNLAFTGAQDFIQRLEERKAQMAAQEAAKAAQEAAKAAPVARAAQAATARPLVPPLPRREVGSRKVTPDPRRAAFALKQQLVSRTWTPATQQRAAKLTRAAPVTQAPTAPPTPANTVNPSAPSDGKKDPQWMSSLIHSLLTVPKPLDKPVEVEAQSPPSPPPVPSVSATRAPRATSSFSPQTDDVHRVPAEPALYNRQRLLGDMGWIFEGIPHPVYEREQISVNPAELTEVSVAVGQRWQLYAKLQQLHEEKSYSQLIQAFLTAFREQNGLISEMDTSALDLVFNAYFAVRVLLKREQRIFPLFISFAFPVLRRATTLKWICCLRL